MMSTGIICKLTFLLLPVTGITLWFLYDGGIGLGWNLIWYWIWIIGFLTVYTAGVVFSYFYNRIKGKRNKENILFMLVGLSLLVIASGCAIMQLT
ncbi:hypothetical protein [Niastella populi]|uniref:Uncharacterized protein n=1 Tax=Niastella populi TaxID=550983 RepID=A0A1V9FJV1_9BACT|nr:hypothetical protein [Niastella populi]OQP58577.1 hypothetical protein A4R26_03740 [Niastella populi]